MPQSQVYDVIQDDLGTLWLGTQGGGLCSFDGADFTTYRENQGLASNFIHALSFKNDSLFIGTRKGLSVKSRAGFYSVKTPSINVIFHNQEHTYLGTSEGVYKYSKKGVTKIKLHAAVDQAVVKDIIFDGKEYWIATNKGLWRSDDLEINANISSYESKDFTDLLVFKNTIIAATFSEGIYYVNSSDATHNVFFEDEFNINQISIKNENELWIATTDKGIVVVDIALNKQKKKIDRSVGLGVLHVRKCIMDAQDNIWIATSGGGLYKYFQNNFKHYDRSTGLKGNRIYAVHAAGNELWVSNSEAGLVMIDSMGIHPIPINEALAGVKIKTITHDNRGNIWAGTDGRGILFRERRVKDSLVFNSTSIGIVQIDTIEQEVIKNHTIDTSIGLPSDWIRTLVIQDSTIWAATYADGIVQFKYDPLKEEVKVLQTYGKNEGIQDPLIRDIKFDNQGKLWYATQNGFLGHIKNNKATDLGKVLDKDTALATLLFHKDRLFIGTLGDGVWWSALGDSMQFYKLEGDKAMYSENVYQLIFDNEDQLWVGTEQGVDRVTLDPTNLIIDVLHFGRNDGFLGIETCLNAVAKDSSGDLWFGAIYGLTRHKASNASRKTVAPKLWFETISVGNQPIEAVYYAEQQINKTPLQLSPLQTQLTFSYKAVDLDHPKDIEYRFKLNETTWSPWSKIHQQNFAGLDYGEHTFYAQARNYRWDESDVVSFPFTIETPLLKKAWFQWSLLCLGLLILGIIGWSYIRKLKRKNEEMQERLQIENHLLSLEQKALRLQMNPHFIFNVLNGIKAMGANNPKKMNTTINSFATLLRETLYNSRKDKISLEQEMKTLDHYIKVEQLMAPKSFTYDINLHSSLDAEEVLIPPMLIQPFVENAVRHGILKGEQEGVLKIEFKTDTSFLYCKVVDNGIGIFTSQKSKTNTDHQSMALKVTRERLASIAGKNSLEIKELRNTEAAVIGTEVSFKIPLETDY